MTTGRRVDEPPEGGFARAVAGFIRRTEPGAQLGDQEARRLRGLLTSLTIRSLTF
jgi:hypothetical protein